MALTPLALKLAARISTEGPISFHDYMAACLYDPEFGYYIKADAIGATGDFVTAPEISQVFGELIGLWAGETWANMGAPRGLRLIELGPGRGTLMADALRALRVVPNFLQNATVHLVEMSDKLLTRQQETLQGVRCQISWHQHLNEIPPGPSIIIANEFVDCLPVTQLVFDGEDDGWRERVVDFIGGAFDFRSGNSVVMPEITTQTPESGDILELRPAATALIKDFAHRALNAPLAGLIVDYGFDRPAFGDTIQAVRAHRFSDVFDAPGEIDLTAHVNFADLAHSARNAGFNVFGPMPMGEWLLRLGLEARASQLVAAASDGEHRTITAAVSRLVDPSAMGVLFKVMAITRGISTAPVPFLDISKDNQTGEYFGSR